LSQGTIRENITLWDRIVSEKDIEKAAKDALIHEHISSMPGGYDSYIAENGSNLSFGQKQQLDIARALVFNPSLIVLDEATSSLGPLLEEKIHQNIKNRGCSVIVMAHTLSALKECDEILVLERGRIVERGTHESLYAKENSAYRELVIIG